MIIVCRKCLRSIAKVSPVNEERVDYGVCRFHELETMMLAGTAKPEQREEFLAEAGKTIKVVVSVPARINAEVERLRRAAIGRAFRDPIGDLIEREINRAEWEQPTSPQPPIVAVPKETTHP